MMKTGVRKKICGICGKDKVWVGDPDKGVRFRMCWGCDSDNKSLPLPDWWDVR